MNKVFLVTGALGCLGAWTMKNLLDANERVVAFDLGTDVYRWKLVMSDDEIARIQLIHGDISDYATVERVLRENEITHVIHLAALQVPFCKANPVLGAQVNVVGTVNVFEAATKLRAQVQRVVYASSAAAYGPANLYPPGAVTEALPLAPTTLYGAYKQANEATARVYFQDNGVESVGIRPYVIYGLGRDRGITSSPTKAMLAAALGRDYQITYGGRANFQWGQDAAQTFIECATYEFHGAGIFNLGGSVAAVREIVETINTVVPDSRGKITFMETPLAFPEELDASKLRATFGAVPETPLLDGVRATVEQFRELVAQNRIDIVNALA
jgi:nucleoside-diphosphate-sugar epimerase